VLLCIGGAIVVCGVEFCVDYVWLAGRVEFVAVIGIVGV